MSGGLIQLTSVGNQDVYLTGNPQITFWKVVYRRHTNFALESVEQTFNGAQGSSKNMVATISRNGDLIHKCYLEVTTDKFSDKVEEFFGVEDDDAAVEVTQEQNVNVEGPTINITIPEQKKDTVVKKVYIKPKPKLTETEKRKKEGIDW